MPDIANYIAQNQPRFNRSEIDRRHMGNALLRNEVDRIPQANQAQDLGLKAADQAINQRGTDHARKIAADMFTAIADSQDPVTTAATLVRTPLFQQISKDLGFPQFDPQPGDNPEEIRQKSRAWAQISGSGSQQQQQRVQSTFTGKNGNQWLVTSDGRAVDTGVPVSQFAQRPVETGAGIESFDPSRGTAGGPISPAAAAPALNQAAQDRKFSENLGSGRGQAQADFEAGTRQRNERARQAITNIDNVLAAVDSAVGRVDWSTTGFVGNMAKNVAGTPAHDLQQQLLTIQANLGFDRIQQMRDSSPTGGALGQVAVQELNALQASVAALAQSQSDQQLRANLEKVKTHYTNWRNVISQSQGGAAPGGLPQGVSEEDLQYTMQLHGLTREQVLEKLGAR